MGEFGHVYVEEHDPFMQNSAASQAVADCLHNELGAVYQVDVGSAGIVI